jgi:hypothetical protein
MRGKGYSRRRRSAARGLLSEYHAHRVDGHMRETLRPQRRNIDGRSKRLNATCRTSSVFTDAVGLPRIGIDQSNTEIRSLASPQPRRRFRQDDFEGRMDGAFQEVAATG